MSGGRNPSRTTVDARRQQVSALLAKRLTYRAIGAELNVAHTTIVADVKALRKQWAESIGAAESVFADSAMALDRWQARVESDLDLLTPDQRPQAVNTLARLNDLRLKLFGLYPRAGSDTAEIPTGPITLEIRMIPSGNRQYISDEERDDEPYLDDGETESESDDGYE